jgi:hypothetical protein
MGSGSYATIQTGLDLHLISGVEKTDGGVYMVTDGTIPNSLRMILENEEFRKKLLFGSLSPNNDWTPKSGEWVLDYSKSQRYIRFDDGTESSRTYSIVVLPGFIFTGKPAHGLVPLLKPETAKLIEGRDTIREEELAKLISQ